MPHLGFIISSEKLGEMINYSTGERSTLRVFECTTTGFGISVQGAMKDQAFTCGMAISDADGMGLCLVNVKRAAVRW